MTGFGITPRHLWWALVLLLSLAHGARAQDNTAAQPAEAIRAPEKVSGIPGATGWKTQFWKDWVHLAPDLLEDQKRIWLFPVSVARGRHLKPTMAVIGATAGLVALDAYPARYFRNTKSFNGFNTVFSGAHTARANYMIPLALYGIGLVRRDSYAQQTFIQAGEAVLDSEVLTSVMKDLDRRWNPADTRPLDNYNDTWFKYKFSDHLIVGNGSMPSGHTITAFAVATVYADRYKKPRWLPWLAYGLATLDAFSRISEQSHFTSDVFAGAALGYIMGHNVVHGAR